MAIGQNNVPQGDLEPNKPWLNSHKLWGYVFLFLIFAGTVGAIYWYQYGGDSKQETENNNQNQTAKEDETADWKIYTNTEYGLELKYPPTWKVQEKVTGFGFWINPPDFKMPDSGTVNPYFSFDVTAHMYQGDEKPVIKMFGTRTGYVYVKDQSVYFSATTGTGGYFIKLYTPTGVDEPNQILSTFKFTSTVSAESLVLEINSDGGLCVYGMCKDKISLKMDRSYTHDTWQQKQESGKLFSADMAELIRLIEQTNFSVLREKKFTGDCPTSYDGQEHEFVFYTSKGVENISDCETQIDYNSGLFGKIKSLFNVFQAQ